jgi:hypothetical protein
MNRFFGFVLFVVFVFGVLVNTRNSKKEPFVDLSENERDAIESPYDLNRHATYKAILHKFQLPSSDHPEKNFCDILGLHGKKCDVSLAFASK